ncbi:MAG: magnesium chelatase, partial [Dehalococcoidales bacterium]
MLAKVKTAALVGLEGQLVDVEVDIASGLPAFNIVGLPDAAVQEARERVRAAIRNSGCTFPTKRIVVNLAPADLKKAGPAYDLPIAVGILLSSEQVYADVSQTLFIGELSLDGSLRHTNGVLPMVALSQEKGLSDVVAPDVNAKEASLIEGSHIIPFDSLSRLVSYLRGEIPAPEYQPD